MKRKLTFGAAIAIAATFGFVGLAFNASANSLQELAGEGTYYCEPCGDCKTDCASEATGNIYPHYKASNYPTTPVILP